MPRFNFASQTAAAQTAATPTPVVTEPTAPVAQPEPTAVEQNNETTQQQNNVAPTSQAQKAVAKLNELMTADALLQHTYMDEERHEARIQFTSSATDPEGLKKAAHWLSALNAEWVFEGTGKERTAKSASLPSVVMTDATAAESAHEAARAKWDARKQRNEEYKAKKAQTQTPQPPSGGVDPAAATVSNGSVVGGSRTFSEAEVRNLLKKANATLTAELIDLLIKTA